MSYDWQLRRYIAGGGQRVAHVGEWQGITGTAAFEQLLCANFTLQKSVALPNIDSSAGLTIWKRRVDAVRLHIFLFTFVTEYSSIFMINSYFLNYYQYDVVCRRATDAARCTLRILASHVRRAARRTAT